MFKQTWCKAQEDSVSQQCFLFFFISKLGRGVTSSD